MDHNRVSVCVCVCVCVCVMDRKEQGMKKKSKIRAAE